MAKNVSSARVKTALLLAAAACLVPAPAPCRADEGDFVADGAALYTVVDGALVAAGGRTFADAFDKGLSADWKPDAAHTWAVADGSLSSTGYGGRIALLKELGDGYVVEASVRPLATDPRGGGFAGIEAGGVLFTMQPGRWWWQYRKAGQERMTGSWRDAEIPFDRWYRYKIVRRPGGAFSWYVDGKKICDIVDPEMKGGLAFLGWRVKTAYDDVSVYRIDAKKAGGAAAVNLVRNSSFERHDDDIPPFWAPTRFRDIPATFGDLAAFHESWAVDAAERRDGTVSMRLGGAQPNGLRSYVCSLTAGKTYTLSLDMKSDAETMPVAISLAPGGSRTVTADRTWRRHVLVVPEIRQTRAAVTVSPRGAGRLWVDAVQLEEGGAATPYRPNPLDGAADGALKEDPVPRYALRRTSKAPVLDGALDDPAWNRTTLLSSPRIPTPLPGRYTDPREKTDIYLCHDAGNLYIAFRCFTPRAQAPEIAGDGIEIFLDTTLDRATYYWFRLDPSGKRTQSRIFDGSWRADWTAKTVRLKDAWTAEIAIPLSALEIGPLTSRSWGINLCRGNLAAGEQSCIAPTIGRGMYFHNAARYPVFEWDDPAVFRGYRFAFENMAISRATDGTLSLSGGVRNASADERRAIVQAEIGGRTASSPPLLLKKGAAAPFILAGFPPSADGEIPVDVRLADAASGRALRRSGSRLTPAAPVAVVVDRSYYTDEAEAFARVRFPAADGEARMSGAAWRLTRAGARAAGGDLRLSGPEAGIRIPLAGLPDGDYELTVVCRDAAGRETASAADRLRKLPPVPGAVKISRTARCLIVDDKPFFPFAPLQCFHVPAGHAYGDYDAYIARIMEYWAANGFTTLVVGANVDKVKGPWGERIWDTVFDVADRKGMKIIAFWTGPWHAVLIDDRARLAEYVLRWRNRPSLLAWQAADEPEISNLNPADVAAGIARIRELDPYHPVYINYTQMGPATRYAGLPGDLMSLDYYLTSAEGRTIAETLRYVDAMEAAAGPRLQPVWNFIVGSNIDNHSREISADEQTAQTYANAIKGVSGLAYFFGQPMGRRHWERMKQLNREIRKLTPVLLSAEPAPRPGVAPASILATTRVAGGKLYLIAVNIEDRRVPASFDLSAATAARKASVLFENRETPVADGILKDTFEPFSRHVYELAM